MGARVIVGCRDVRRGEAARALMCARAQCDAERVRVVELDLSRRESVRAFARAVLNEDVPVSILVTHTSQP